MSDPTMEALERFKHKEAWDHVQPNVPIMMAHHAYLIKGKLGDVLKMIFDDSKPKGGKLLYSIGESELEEIAKSINYALEQHGKAIKITLGHLRQGKDFPETQQPPIVAYGVGAKVGKFGPKNRLAVLTTQYTRKGWWNEAKEYPERSPDFYPDSNEISGLALLKRDPRMPMGMMIQHQKPGRMVQYQRGFDMADENDPLTPDGETSPTETPDAAAGPSPEDKAMFDKFMQYMMTQYPQMAALCQGAPAQAAAVPPAAATPGAPAMPPTEDPKMAQMSQKIAELNCKLAKKDTDRHLDHLAKEKGVIFDRDAEFKRMVQYATDGERETWAHHMEKYYAKDDIAPIAPGNWVITEQGHEGKASAASADVSPQAIVRYAEEHDIDIQSDEGYASAMVGIQERTRKTSGLAK